MPVVKLNLDQKRELAIRGAVGQQPGELARIFKITRQHVHRLINEYKANDTIFDPCHHCGATFRKPNAGDLYCSMECEIKDGEAMHAAIYNGNIPAIKKLMSHKLKEEKAAILRSIQG